MHISLRPVVLIFIICLQALFGNAREPINVAAKSSLVFVENKGQVTDQHYVVRHDIDFKINVPGIDIFIGNGQIHYQWNKTLDNALIETYRLDMTLQGANPNSLLIAEDIQPYYENYYLPSCEKGVTGHSYNKLVYKNVYPNIDWSVYVYGSGLKYDFIVHAGGDVNQIRLQYNGAMDIAITNGALHVNTPLGSITEDKPYTYSAISKTVVQSKYKLDGNILSFDVEDHAGDIVIDPQLDWVTYFGGSASDMPFGIFYQLNNPNNNRIFNRADIGRELVVNSAGEIIFAGGTSSISNIATSGAYQQTLSGSGDCVLSKFSATGAIIWATYYGGAGDESIQEITCDKNNLVNIVGYTSSENLATPGAFQQQYDSVYETHDAGGNPVLLKSYNSLIAQFDDNGLRKWATYYGITRHGFGYQNSIETDEKNSVYALITTLHDSLFVSSGAYFNKLKNANAALSSGTLLIKFNAQGTRQWATYITDSISNSGLVDFSYNYKGQLITAPGLGVADSFSCFDTLGTLVWRAYCNVDYTTFVSAIECDTSGDFYISGTTSADTSIATSGSFQQGRIGYMDGFLFKYSGSGEKQWGTYFGGNGNITDLNTMAIDAYGDINIVGYTDAVTGIATAGGFQKRKSDSLDALFVKFDKNGNRLWGTYLGGRGTDMLNGAVADNSNRIYILGITSSSSGIATAGAYQTTRGGSYDMMLMRTDPDSISYIANVDSIICIPPSGNHSFNIGYILSRSFRNGNVVTVQLSDSNGNFSNVTNIGSITSTTSGFVNCSIPSGIPLGKGYRMRVVTSMPYYISDDNGVDIDIRQGPEKPEAFADSIVCEGGIVHLYASCPTPNVGFSWVGPANYRSNAQNPVRANAITNMAGSYIVTVTPAVCKMSDTVNVIIAKNPAYPVIKTNAPVCEGDSIILQNASDTANVYSYEWQLPSTQKDSTHVLVIKNATRADEGLYTLKVSRYGCSSSSTNSIVVKRKPKLKATSNSPIRIGQDLYLNADVDSGIAEYIWTGPNGFISTDGHTYRTVKSHDYAGVYNITATVDGCIDIKQIVVITEDGLDYDDYFELVPNPNKGTFIIKGIVKEDQSMPLEVVDMLGQTIFTALTRSENKQVHTTISLHDIAQGEYFLIIRVSGKNRAYRFVISK